jgi:hypothetical protein
VPYRIKNVPGALWHDAQRNGALCLLLHTRLEERLPDRHSDHACILNPTPSRFFDPAWNWIFALYIINCNQVLGIAQHVIHQSILLCFQRIEKAVTTEHLFNLLSCVPREFADEIKHLVLQPFLLFIGNANILCIPFGASARRMHVHGRMWQCIALPT